MNTSDWNDKLLKQKLAELPLSIEAEGAWNDMQVLLDTHLPVTNNIQPSLPSSLPAKLFTVLSYLAGAALIIASIIYLTKEKAENLPAKRDSKDTVITPAQTPVSPIQDTLTNVITLPQAINSDVLEASGADESIKAIASPHLVQAAPVLKVQLPTGDTLGTNLKSEVYNESETKSKNTLSTDTQNNLITQDHPITKDSATTQQRLSEVNSQTADLNSRPDKRTKPDKKIKDNRQKAKKIKPLKEKAENKQSGDNINYGISLGIYARKELAPYFGVFGKLKINKQVSLNAGVFYNRRTITGKYSHPSYTRPDSLPAFTFTDSRKLSVIDIPVMASYKLNERLSINAGPILSFPVSRSKTSLGTISKPSDTLRNGNQIRSALDTTSISKMNFGLKTGVSLQLKRVGLDLHYQWISPYKLKNTIGTNQSKYNSVLIGISYQIK